MADLISRAELAEMIRTIPDISGLCLEQVIAVRDVLEMIEHMPAVDAAPVVRCKDCKYFETKDIWADFGKVPILVSDVPTCHRWEGECKTSPDGYCFLGKRRKEDAAD